MTRCFRKFKKSALGGSGRSLRKQSVSQIRGILQGECFFPDILFSLPKQSAEYLLRRAVLLVQNTGSQQLPRRLGPSKARFLAEYWEVEALKKQLESKLKGRFSEALRLPDRLHPSNRPIYFHARLIEQRVSRFTRGRWLLRGLPR